MHRITKTLPAVILPLFAVSAHATLADWYTQVTATANNVVAATGGGGGGQTGANGSGWSFTGSTGTAFDYGNLAVGYNTAGANIGNTSAGATYATIEYIFNLSDTGNSLALGSYLGFNGTETYVMKLEQYNNSGRFGVTSSSVRDATIPGGTSAFNRTVNATFVLNAAAWTLYIDGVSKGTDSAGALWRLVGGAGTLGSAASLTSDRVSGTISGVATYNRALSASEVLANYQAYSAVPEPAAYGLLGAGALAGITVLRRRRRA